MSSETCIRIIPKEDTVKICTAQVVVTLAGAARQMIDNCIDAGATSIDIRCKNYGFDCLEVVDNGCGIDAKNFGTLCKPHATSKLNNFSDLQDISTLGFRGEALNALCALGNVTIVTRSDTASVGTKLTYNHMGESTDKTNVARQIGTTVAVESLFSTLPVRRKEFEKTAKREFSKLLGVVQCFALSKPGIKFICANTLNGKRHQAICTYGANSSLKDVVINLFGGRSDRNKMMDIEWDNEIVEEEATIYGLSVDDKEQFKDIQISGFVSSCEHGFGRSSADRQFLYINGRPVDYPKICRAVNEVYQQYNRGQYPTIVMHITVPPDSIDVNVTPDKRTVFFDREKQLLAVIRSALLSTFRPLLGTHTSVQNIRRDSAKDGNAQGVPSIFDMLKDCSNSNPKRSRLSEIQTFAKRTRLETNDKNTSFSSSFSPNRSFTNESMISTSSIGTPTEPIRTENRVRTLEQFAFKLVPHSVTNNFTENIKDYAATPKREKSAARGSRSPKSSVKSRSSLSPRVTPVKKVANEVQSTCIPSPTSAQEDKNRRKDSASSLVPNSMISSTSRPSDTSIFDKLRESQSSGIYERLTGNERKQWQESMEDVEKVVCRITKKENVSTPERRRVIDYDEIENDHAIKSEVQSQVNSQLELNTSSDERIGFVRTQQKVNFSMSKLRARISAIKVGRDTKEENMNTTFCAVICPDKSEDAERELDKAIRKSDFADMSILGQFNSGFIITRLMSHLFIVDQHASDEKYNFEKLQKRAKVDTQRLLTPQSLDIGAVQEAVLHDNIDIFRANGFDFVFNQDQCAQLASVPVLHSWQFDKGDIDEILSEVSEHPGVMYRPQKLRRIFASRACRKSVMIGTTLTHPQMRKIVQHLGTLDHPWNCPHGRPTLRHLIDLRNLS